MQTNRNSMCNHEHSMRSVVPFDFLIISSIFDTKGFQNTVEMLMAILVQLELNNFGNFNVYGHRKQWRFCELNLWNENSACPLTYTGCTSEECALGFFNFLRLQNCIIRWWNGNLEDFRICATLKFQNSNLKPLLRPEAEILKFLILKPWSWLRWKNAISMRYWNEN